jgi:jouberin
MYLKDPKILQGFSALNRFWEGVYEEFQPKNGANFAEFMTKMDQNPLNIPTEDLPEALGDLRFSLKALETSSLRIDQNVRDPFLTVHVVDLATGLRLNVVSEGFSWTDFDRPSKAVNSETTKDPNLRLSTAEFSLVSGRKTSATWNETLNFRIKKTDLKRTSLLLLFEIHNYYSAWTPQKTKESKLNKLCWGYLRPFSADLTHQGAMKIRLFEYRLNHKRLGKCPYPDVPLVYFDFLWHLKDRYEAGFLVIDFTFQKGTPGSRGSLDDSDHSSASKKSYKQLGSQNCLDPKKSEEEIEKERFLQAILYSPDEGYRTPDTLLRRLNTSSFGCSAVKFSPNGRFLAYACTDRLSFTSIRIFDFEGQRSHCILYGHTNIVHRLAWSACSQFVASCSSDRMVKVFKIPKKPKMDESASLTKMLKYKRVDIAHPSFVYDVGFILEETDDQTDASRSTVVRMLATCGADGAFRVFNVDLGNSKSEEIAKLVLPADTFPNCFTFSHKTLFIGSSHGRVHRYQLDGEFGRVRLVEHESIEPPEISGDIINELKTTEDGELLVVQTRDNCLRLVEVKTGNVINRYFRGQVLTHNIKCFVSPDFRLLMSGCESGETRVWDFVSAVPINPVFDYRINGTVYTGDCNPKYNALAICGFGQNFPLAIFHAKPSEGSG